MNKFLIIFLLIVFLLSTLLICVFLPKSHKHIIFENKNFKTEMLTAKLQAEKSVNTIDFQQIKVPRLPEINISDKNKEKTQDIKQTETKTTNNANIKTQRIIKTTTEKNITTAEFPKETTQKSQTSGQMPIKPKPDNQIQTNITLTELNKKENTKADEIETVSQSENPPIPGKIEQQDTKTKEELEIIAWNKWRSDLQNQLMRDSKITAPIGTTFYFSFTVDKYGNISNLKTWSNNASYTPVAVRIIKPLLLSYQHSQILKFPTNSERIMTNAEGSFTMAYSNRYSSPSDYNDYERVIK